MNRGMFVTGVARILVALMLVAGVVQFGTSTSTEAVSKYARITIHKATCPAKTKGSIFDKCHGNYLQDVPFTVINETGHGTTRLTDANGQAKFGPRAGLIVIMENPSDFNSYNGAYVYCKDQNTNTVFMDRVVSLPWISIQTAPGAVVICDWYNRT